MAAACGNIDSAEQQVKQESPVQAPVKILQVKLKKLEILGMELGLGDNRLTKSPALQKWMM